MAMAEYSGQQLSCTVATSGAATSREQYISHQLYCRDFHTWHYLRGSQSFSPTAFTVSSRHRICNCAIASWLSAFKAVGDFNQPLHWRSLQTAGDNIGCLHS